MIKLIKRYSNFNPPVIIGSLSIVLGLMCPSDSANISNDPPRDS